jgi:diguanylate cyclase
MPHRSIPQLSLPKANPNRNMAPQVQERERRRQARSTERDMVPSEDAPLPSILQATGTDIADVDWDVLFHAVQVRLTEMVSASGWGVAAASEAGAAQLRQGVLECVAALGLLQHAVTRQRLRRDGLETAVFEAQTSLAQVRAALVGTQRGERRARHEASHDALTSLPNRAFLIKCLNVRLASTHARQHSCAVMFLDLDGFKQVNDLHGHGAGDAVLRIVAARLRRVVRAQDVVSRIGGDDFACLIGDMDDRAQLAQLADKMVYLIAQPCTVGPLQLVVHASVGIAVCPADAGTSEALLAGADLAMYAAKQQRSGHAFVSRDGAAAATAALQAPAPPTPPPPRS